MPDESLFDTVGIAIGHLTVALRGQQSPADTALHMATQIEKCLSALGDALALIPDLDQIVISHDMPFIRKFYEEV